MKTTRPTYFWLNFSLSGKPLKKRHKGPWEQPENSWDHPENILVTLWWHFEKTWDRFSSLEVVWRTSIKRINCGTDNMDRMGCKMPLARLVIMASSLSCSECHASLNANIWGGLFLPSLFSLPHKKRLAFRMVLNKDCPGQRVVWHSSKIIF